MRSPMHNAYNARMEVCSIKLLKYKKDWEEYYAKNDY